MKITKFKEEAEGCIRQQAEAKEARELMYEYKYSDTKTVQPNPA